MSSSPPKKNFRGGHANGVSSPRSPSPHHRQPYRKHDYLTKHGALLHRLNPPSSPPSRTLLERIGGLVEDVGNEVASTLTDSDWIDAERMTEWVDSYPDLPFSATPRLYTPEPGEAERFLESVIAPPSPSSPSSPGLVHTCSGNKPILALETHNLTVNHPVTVHAPSSSVLYSPTQTAVNNLLSANPTLDHYQHSPLLGDTMPPPSPSTIEECKKHLVPVLLASAQARDPERRLDSEQCLRLLSDDHCKNFFKQAKEMRLQLASLVSQKTPVNQSWSDSSPLKRGRAEDDVDAWAHNTRSRSYSVNTVASDVSRKDSDITLIDFVRGRLPPRAPRAMLQPSQAALSQPSIGAKALYEALVASPITEDSPQSAMSLIEPTHQAVQILPTLRPTSQPATETDASNKQAQTPTGDQPGRLSQDVVSPTHAVPLHSADFVSQLPTQPGIWFSQRGRQYAEIVDVDIDVSGDMFYASRERLQMYLRLCSVPVNAARENTGIDDVIERHAHHWPSKGKLVVQVNPGSERARTWLPYILESEPLDVTSCMRPGRNTFRFIQLSDLSEFVFVLAASPPPPKEEWRSWDWASLVERPRARSSTSIDDPMNGLSEFAHLPVTVRS